MENAALFHFSKTEKCILYISKCVSRRHADTIVIRMFVRISNTAEFISFPHIKMTEFGGKTALSVCLDNALNVKVCLRWEPNNGEFIVLLAHILSS